MKLFDVDWTKVLRDLSRWWPLPVPARRALLDELRMHGYVPGERFGDELNAVVASGIPEFDAERNRVWVGEDMRALVKILRAMGRHALFDAPSPEALIRYVEEHFTNAETEALSAHVAGRYVQGPAARHVLAARIAGADWVGDLVNAGSDQALAAWANARGLDARLPGAGWSILVLKDLQRLVRRVLASPGGVPLRDLIALATDDVAALGRALDAGLASGVVLAGMRGTDLEPMVGVWPAAVRELTRAPATRPSAVAPVERFALAVRMEDMTTMLGASVSAPVRLRADDLGVFANARKAIETRIVATPPWAAHLFHDDGVTRVDVAARELELHGLVEVRELAGYPHLTATEKGKQWLALVPRERLASLIDRVRQSTEQNPRGAYDGTYAESFFPFVLPYIQVPKSLRLRDALTKAFLSLGTDFIPLEAFLDYAARDDNPFLSLPRSASGGVHPFVYATSPEDPRQSYRNLWRNMLAQFLVVRLIGLGGASIGRLENGSLCFALTDAGRYLLGASDEFEYGSADVGDVIVQPNFDIVFLGAAPNTEATVARLADRVGAAPGLAFRITRASVLGAAEAGATADDIMGALRSASSKPVPKNVEREIVGWVGAVRRARLRMLEVVECADVEAADRVVTLLGTKVHRLTPTIVELPPGPPAGRQALLKKLRAAGVFLESATSPVTAPSARTRRREDDWESDDERFD